jgi:uncharacterized membrane protein
MYLLHAIGLGIGAFSQAATVVGAFVFGWTSIIAIIINYVKRSDVRGTYLDSHFGWQLRTFWYAVLWVIVAAAMVLTLIGIPFAWILAIVVGLWVLYRIIRGWMALLEGRPMPQPDDRI